jgi:hypothetical protein
VLHGMLPTIYQSAFGWFFFFLLVDPGTVGALVDLQQPLVV